MRITFLEPKGALTPRLVLDTLGLVGEYPPPIDAIKLWTNLELLIAYDWAMRTHLRAADNHFRLRPKPWFVTKAEAEISR